MKFIVQRVPISPNERERLHWTDRHRANKKWRTDILKALGRDKFCEVGITLHRRRLLDVNNAFSSLKPVIDGLRDTGLIVNDSARWCVIKADQVQDAEDFTEIEIEEVQ